MRNQAFCVQNYEEVNMNMLTEFNSNVKTMSSRETAILCEKNHNHVLRDIRTMINNPKMDAVENKDFFINYRTDNGQVSEILLNEELTMTLITGYDIALRNRVIKRWKQLELQQSQPRELSRIEILQMAMEAEQQKLVLQQQVQLLEPKAQALDDLADSTNTYTIRQVATTIGIKEKRLIEFLIAKNWIYRDNTKYRRLCTYARSVDRKLMINKVTSLVSTCEGDKAYVQARITAFGLTRLTAMVKKAGIAI